MTDLKGRKVLVTGAGGFIGSHLVDRLLDAGAEVTAVVRYNGAGTRGHLDQLNLLDQEKVRVVAGDLCDPGCADEAVAGQEFIFHLAAIIAIPFSFMRPGYVLQNNVNATLNLLDAARRHGVKRFVHTSSSEVYGTAQTVPITEAHPLEAQSPYAASKIACDKLAQSYYCSYSLPVVTLRPFNTYGPRQSARAIIPATITQALTRDKVFLGAMHPTRDFLFVGDTVEGFMRIALTPGIEGRTYHIGTGTEVSIGDLADRIVALTGRKVSISFDATRIRPHSSEVERLLADAARARADLGWEPKSRLDDGLRQTIEWVAEHLAAYRPDIYHV